MPPDRPNILDTPGAMEGITTVQARALLKSPTPLFTDYTTVSSVSINGTEDVLHTHTVAAGQLAANGDRVDFEYLMRGLAHATATRTFKVYFAGTAFINAALGAQASGCAMWCRGSVIRVSATAVRLVHFMGIATQAGTTITTLGGFTDIAALTLTNTQVFKTAGIAAAAGAAASDITSVGGSLTFVPAP